MPSFTAPHQAAQDSRAPAAEGSMSRDARSNARRVWTQTWVWALLVFVLLGFWSALGSSSFVHFLGSYLLKLVALGLAYWVLTIWGVTFSTRANDG